jgi:addiction module HigA family antidote
MPPSAQIHPGEILAKEFAEPLGLSYYKIAQATGLPASRLHEIVAGNRSVSPDTAIRFARAFGTSAEFWLNLQAHYDLAEVKKANSKVYQSIRSLITSAQQEPAGAR